MDKPNFGRLNNVLTPNEKVLSQLLLGLFAGKTFWRDGLKILGTKTIFPCPLLTNKIGDLKFPTGLGT